MSRAVVQQGLAGIESAPSGGLFWIATQDY
jgi:hypothetical protein